jgi:hypothetical protein
VECKVVDLSKEEYKRIFKNFISDFDSVEFNKINENKCREILYLGVKIQDEYRFGLIGGITDEGIFKVPYSAPFSIVVSTKKNRLKYFHLFVKTIVDFIENKEFINEISFTLPPKIYNEAYISSLENALYVNGFVLSKLDLNYHFNVNEFDETYIEKLDVKARQKLRSALKKDLEIVKAQNVSDVKKAYDIIRKNRKWKGYPLRMTYENVLTTIEIIDADFFIVKNSEGIEIASAMVYRVNPKIALLVYWGNIEKTDNLKPMNFLAYKLNQYYQSIGVDILDIGPSTDDSIPNYGLCDFKESVGCDISTKSTFRYIY